MHFKKIQAIRTVNKLIKVFNFDVPKFETYIANGVVVHNCQNFSVSQANDGPSKVVSPVELWDTVRDRTLDGIAFTYNEPTVHLEYVLDVCSFKNDRPVVLKTNGFVTERTATSIAEHVDAFNVDLKGDNEEYERICGGSLRPVQRSVELFKELGNHVEISYLVTPRLLNQLKHHIEMRSWLSAMPDVPVHILYFYPFHKMRESSYDPADLVPIADFFREKLNYVYISNVYRQNLLHYRNTNCTFCGKTLINRERKTIIENARCCNKEVVFHKMN